MKLAYLTGVVLDGARCDCCRQLRTSTIVCRLPEGETVDGYQHPTLCEPCRKSLWEVPNDAEAFATRARLT